MPSPHRGSLGPSRPQGLVLFGALAVLPGHNPRDRRVELPEVLPGHLQEHREGLVGVPGHVGQAIPDPPPVPVEVAQTSVSIEAKKSFSASGAGLFTRT